MGNVFRVTTYRATSDLHALTIRLVLPETLSTNYFVMVVPVANGTGSTIPKDVLARVTADPYGTGDLALASGNYLELTRTGSGADWDAQVTVVECLRDEDRAGFRLLTVRSTNLAALGGAGIAATTDTSPVTWKDPARIALFGGPRGGGCSLTSGGETNAMWPSGGIRLYPSGTATMNFERYALDATSTPAVDVTTYIVEWGDEWDVRRATIRSSAGGSGVNAIGEYGNSTFGTDPRTLSQTMWSWWDAQDESSFTFSAGVTVSVWGDRSGNGNHLNVLGAGAPTRTASDANFNGAASVAFTSDEIETTATTTFGDFTVLAAFRITSLGSYETIVEHDFAGGWSLHRDSATAHTFGLAVLDSGAPYGSYSAEFRDGDVHVIVGRRSGTTRTIWRDGKIVVQDTCSGTTTTSNVVSVGGRVNGIEMLADAQVAEVCVWSGALTDAELRGQVDRVIRKVRGIAGAPVVRAKAWTWATGWTAQDGVGDSWTGAVVVLGDGVTAAASEYMAASALATTVDRRFESYVFSHPDLSTSWQFHPTGDAGSQDYTYTVPAPLGFEVAGTDAAGLDVVVGGRFGLQTTNITSGSTSIHSEVLFGAYHSASTSLVVRRGDATPTLGWAAWVQNVDLGAISAAGRSDRSPVFRVTTYRIDGEFTGATYDLTLLNDLATHYFVMVHPGSVGDTASPSPATFGVRVTRDPNGTGDLVASSGANVIRLERTTGTGPWFGTITVVECLRDYDRGGFRLRDVRQADVVLSASASTGQTTDVTLTAGAGVVDAARCVPFGGVRGGGWTADAAATASDMMTAGATFELVDKTTLRVFRYLGASGTLRAASFTTYVVEWGSQWQIQKARFNGAPVTSAGVTTTEAIPTLADPANTWVWAGAATNGNSADETWQSLTVVLGSGNVGLALGAAGTIYGLAYVLSGEFAAVGHSTQSSTATMYASLVVNAVASGESYGVTSQGHPFALGARFLQTYTYNTSATEGIAPSTSWQAVLTGETSAVAFRDFYIGSVAGRYQSIDLGAFVVAADPAAENFGPDAYLVVRDPTIDDDLLAVTATTSGSPKLGQAVPADANRGSAIALQEGTPSGTLGLQYLVTMGGAVSRPTGNNVGYNIASWAWRRAGETPYKAMNALTFLRAPKAVSLAASEYAVAVAYSSAYHRAIIARITNATTITLYYRDANTSNTATWSSTTATVTDARTGFSTESPGLEIVDLPSGRMLMFYTAAGALGSKALAGDVYMLASDDGGLTWTQIESALFARTALFAFVIGTTTALGGQLRGGVSGDWVRLTSIAELPSAVDNLRLYTLASPDRGSSWKAVGVSPAGAFSSLSVYSCQSAANATIGSFPWDIVGVGDGSGTFLLACLDTTETTIRIHAATRDGDWTAQSSLDLVYGTSAVRRGTTAITAGVIRGLCFVRTGDSIWLYWWVDGSDGSEIYAHYVDSTDPLNVSSWIAMGPISTFAGTMKYGPFHWQGVWCGNHVLFASGLLNPDTTVRTNDPVKAGMFTAVIGGWDTRPVAFSRKEGFTQWSVPRSWWRQWHASLGQIGPTADADADANTTWTYTTAGSGSKSWTADWSIANASSTTGTAYWTDSSGTTERTSGEFTVDVAIDAARADAETALDMGIRIRPYSTTAANRVDFTIRMDTDTIVVRDNLASGGAGSNIATLSGVPLNTTGIELRGAWISNTNFEISYRALGTSGETDVTSTGNLTLTGSGAQAATIIDAGILSTTAGGTTSTFKWRDFQIGIGWQGQLSAYTTRPDDLSSTSVSTGAVYVADGLSARFGGSGVQDGDSFVGAIDYERGTIALLQDTPSMMWESTALAVSSLVFDAGDAVARWSMDALVLVGTVDRTAILEFNDADAWGAPATAYNLTADLWPDLVVVDVRGQAVRLAAITGSLPKRGEATGRYLRFVLAGTNVSGDTYQIKSDTDAAGGWFLLDTTDVLDAANYLQPGATAAIFGDRMVWRGSDFQRYRYFRITFPALSTRGTATETHRLAAAVPGIAYDLSVPIEWSWRDAEQPNNTTVRTRRGASWVYQEGPPQRILEGRMVGDFDERQRDELRGLIGKLCGYDARPLAIVVDAARPGPTVVYGRWTAGNQQDNAAWYQDANGVWRTAGDADLAITEER